LAPLIFAGSQFKPKTGTTSFPGQRGKALNCSKEWAKQPFLNSKICQNGGFKPIKGSYMCLFG